MLADLMFFFVPETIRLDYTTLRSASEHCQRRALFSETDAMVGALAKTLLTPVLYWSEVEQEVDVFPFQAEVGVKDAAKMCEPGTTTDSAGG